MNSEISRGQVYFSDLGQRVGSEQSGMRPVIIVQNDIGNQNSPTVIVVPVTSQIKKEQMPTHVSLSRNFGLDEDSMALCEHIDTIDKQRLLGYIGHITDGDLTQLNRALAVSVGLAASYGKKRIGCMKVATKSSDDIKESDEEMLLCLCQQCASQFINSPEHIIRRVNPLQTDKDDCTYCNVRKGVDYRIIKKRKRLGDDRV